MELRRAPGSCPICARPMHVTRLACGECGSVLQGRFSVCRFCQLTAEQQRFVEVFLMSRGNIREVERVLGISYPTVRGRLDGVIEALGYAVEKEQPVSAERRRGVLEALEGGEISAEEAIQLLKDPAIKPGG